MFEFTTDGGHTQNEFREFSKIMDFRERSPYLTPELSILIKIPDVFKYFCGQAALFFLIFPKPDFPGSINFRETARLFNTM